MTQRVVGFDLARCFAIFGMVIVNFKVAMGSDSQGQVWLASIVNRIDGRAAATFLMLAGIGLSLMSRAARESANQVALRIVQVTLLKRSLFLFIVGLLFVPIWPADILHYYGVYIALASCCLTMKSSRVWFLSVSLVVGFLILVVLFEYEQNWNWDTLAYRDFWQPRGFLLNMFFNGFHPVIPWLGFILVGMILGRMDLRDRVTRKRVLLTGLVVAVVAESLSRLLIGSISSGLDPKTTEGLAAVLGTAPMPPLPFYMLAAGGTATVMIAVCVGIGDKFGEHPIVRPFISTGQLALSLYIGHVFLGLGVLDAMGRMKNQTLSFSVVTALVFCAGSVVFAHLWRKKFKRGPIEILMRKLS